MTAMSSVRLALPKMIKIVMTIATRYIGATVTGTTKISRISTNAVMQRGRR